MTLALGAVCSEGVVIVEDKALTRMDNFELLKYDEKLRGVIRNVIFGYEGNETMHDIFVKYVVGDLVMLRDDQKDMYTRTNILLKFCKVMDKLRNINGNIRLKILVARQFPQAGKSDLNVISEKGESTIIESWKTIGDGGVVSDPLIRGYWIDKRMEMSDFAKLSHCIIKFIEKEELAVGVGVGSGNPSIRYMKHGGDTDNAPSPEEFSYFDTQYEIYSKNFRNILGTNYHNLKDSNREFKQRFQYQS